MLGLVARRDAGIQCALTGVHGWDRSRRGHPPATSIKGQVATARRSVSSSTAQRPRRWGPGGIKCGSDHPSRSLFAATQDRTGVE
jgi:hypothetical protein